MICLYDLIKNPLKLLFQPFTRVRLERPNTHAWYRIENANYVTQALEGLVMEVTVWISQRKKSPGKFSLLSEINFHLILESRGVGSTLLQSHAGFIIEGDTPYRHKMHMLKFWDKKYNFQQPVEKTKSKAVYFYSISALHLFFYSKCD